MSGSERREPWVGWMTEKGARVGMGLLSNEAHTDFCVPVIVTRLLPDDPKVGETWIDADGDEVEILGAPLPPDYNGDVFFPVRSTGGRSYCEPVSALTRPPAEKTYRLDLANYTIDTEGEGTFGVDVRATSREEALAKLADALEEVDDG